MASPRGLAYLDTSALFRLVIVEAETAALQDALREWPDRVVSSLAKAELPRAVRRRDAGAEGRALEVLSRVALLPITEAVLRVAGGIGGPICERSTPFTSPRP